MSGKTLRDEVEAQNTFIEAMVKDREEMLLHILTEEAREYLKRVEKTPNRVIIIANRRQRPVIYKDGKVINNWGSPGFMAWWDANVVVSPLIVDVGFRIYPDGMVEEVIV